MSYEVVNINTLKKVGSTNNDEQRYFCPACPEKRGKPDRKGKLYWSVTKNVGYCFYCSTTFFPEEESVEDSVPLFDRRYLSGLEKMTEDLSLFIEEPKRIPFNFGEISEEIKEYLENRNPFLPSLVDTLGLKGWFGKDVGVVIPFWYRGQIVKFQTRFLRKSEPKYYTAIGQKPFYSPQHLFKPLDFETRIYDEITLCEGVFDAIALVCMGYKIPLAVLGKTLTKFQGHLLRLLSPKEITICLDTEDLSCDLQRNIQSSFDLPSVENVDIFCPWSNTRGDPEEYLVSRIVQSSFKSDCAKRVHEWVSWNKERK